MRDTVTAQAEWSDEATLTWADIVGTWTLASAETVMESKVVGRPFGTHPTGALTYTPDGHVSALIAGGDPLIAYAGRAVVRGSEIRHHIDVGVPPIQPGSTLVRRAHLDEDGRLILLAASLDTPGADLALTWAPDDRADQPTRVRTIRWADPLPGLTRAPELAGVDYLRLIRDGELPIPPVAGTLGFDFVAIEEGRAEFSLVPAEYHYNPIGSVHGSVYAALLDSACGCAVQSMLPAGRSYTSQDLTIKFIRGMRSDTGPVRCVGTVRHMGRRTALAEAAITDETGRLYATATSSCVLLP